jgi:hypothetical protein
MICDSCEEKKPYKCFRKLKKFIMFYKVGKWSNCCIECQRKWLSTFGLPTAQGEDKFTLRFD